MLIANHLFEPKPGECCSGVKEVYPIESEFPEEVSAPLSPAEQRRVLEWHRFHRDADIQQSGILLLICLAISIPLLFFSLRTIGEDFVLTVWGKTVEARVVQPDEPMSYTFTLDGKSYQGKTMGRTRGFQPGDPVTVHYLAGSPQISKVAGITANIGLLRLCLTFGVLMAAGAITLWQKRRSLVRQRSMDTQPLPLTAEEYGDGTALAATDSMPMAD